MMSLSFSSIQPQFYGKRSLNRVAQPIVAAPPDCDLLAIPVVEVKVSR